MLNLMASGDISHKPFSEICEMCKHYSRSRAKTGKNVRDPYNRNLKPVSSGGITREEIGNLLEKFKTNILRTIGSQLDTLKIKKKQEEENGAMSIYCPRCRRKHSSREFPLDNISVCGFYTKDHSTDKFPSFPSYYPSIGVEILGSLLMHLGGHGSLGTNPHTQIYNLKFHPIINNNNSGTH
jgi:hypothetical protein